VWGLQERLAKAYLSDLFSFLEPEWALKQNPVYTTNIAGVASSAWLAGVLAALLDELGVASSLRMLA
jgi:hypothetical protein